MRRDQWIGLKESTESLLQPGESCVTCKRPFSKFKEIQGKYQAGGMINDEYELPGYILKDGKIAYECEQTVVWSSGPMIFTALKDMDGNWIQKTLWTGREINNVEKGLADDTNEPIGVGKI